jgi:hypothetical protein
VYCVVRLPKIEQVAKTMTENKPSRIRPPKAVRQKLRSLAVDRVRKDIIHAGRKEEDYSAEDLEYLVADKEKEIWSGIGWKSFGVVALLLGINIGV